MNLSQCGLNLVDIPKQCKSLLFSNVFEFCVNKHNIIPIAVYKRHIEDKNIVPGQNETKEDKNNSKPYVWFHPPRNLELTHHDELFVLCDKNPKDNADYGSMKGRSNLDSI